MAEEITQVVEEVAAKVEEAPAVAAAEVKKTARKAAKKAEAAVAEVKEAAQAAAPSTNGEEPLVAELKATVKDVVETVEKLPVTQKVVEVAKDVAEEVEKNPMAAKVLERVKGAAEEVEKSQIAEQVRKAVKDTAEGIEKSPLLGAAHRVLLAGIGAVALAQEEIEDFVNRLVERGQIAESDAKRMLKDVLEKRKTVLEKTAELVEAPSRAAAELAEAPKRAAAGLAEAPKRAADELEKRVEDILARMNIPTKDEIEALSAKITALTKKVEELKKQA